MTMKINTDHLKNVIAGKLEQLSDEAVADLEYAAETIATGIVRAYEAGDQDSADEMIEQLELLVEIQRIRLNSAAMSALREALPFAVGVLFSAVKP